MKIMGLVVYSVAWAEAYLPSKWHLDPSSRLATTDMGQKWGICPFGAAESPSNTMRPRPRPTSMPGFILIDPTVWPQYTNVKDGQTGQDNGPTAWGKPFYKRSPKNQSENEHGYFNVNASTVQKICRAQADFLIDREFVTSAKNSRILTNFPKLKKS